MRILISAGHSDVDPGACNTAMKLTEAGLGVALRDKVADLLRAKGLEVCEDGLDGKNQPLPQAIALAKKSDFSVELHFNAGPTSAFGVESISTTKLRPLAQALSVAVAMVTKSKLRGAGGWIDQTKSQHSRLGFVADGGGVILEVEFISNQPAMSVYLAKQQSVAEAIAAVIVNYTKGK